MLSEHLKPCFNIQQKVVELKTKLQLLCNDYR